MDIFTKKMYVLVLLLIFIIGGTVTVIKIIEEQKYVRHGETPPDIRPPPPLPKTPEQKYDKDIEQKEPLTLDHDDILTIENANYRAYDTIVLKDRAMLIIKNAFFEHRSKTGKPVTLSVRGESRVIFEQVDLHTSCEQKTAWQFKENSTFEGSNITQVLGCEPTIFAQENARVTIAQWNGASLDICDQSRVSLRRAEHLSVALCFPPDTTADEKLPLTSINYVFPNTLEKNIAFNLAMKDASVDRWIIGIQPQTDVTIRDSQNLDVRIDARRPWIKKTLILENLRGRFFEDHTWNMLDTRLRLVNTDVDDFEPNAHDDNTIITRGSVYSRTDGNDGDAIMIIEDSTIGTIGAKKNAQITVRNSTITKSIHATGQSKIIVLGSSFRSAAETSDDGTSPAQTITVQDSAIIKLINSPWGGTTVEKASGRVIIQ